MPLDTLGDLAVVVAEDMVATHSCRAGMSAAKLVLLCQTFLPTSTFDYPWCGWLQEQATSSQITVLTLDAVVYVPDLG